ncbi:MAG: hypothetical protein ACMXYD_03950 [Candidatus Woesearchaeota archaeon]
MRRAITTTLLLAPLTVALIRVNNNPYFTGNNTYTFLNTIPAQQETLIAAALLLTTTFLLLLAKTLQQEKTPVETTLLLLLSPPILAAAITSPAAIILALLALYTYKNRQNNTASITATLAVLFHQAAISIAAPLLLYQLYNKQRTKTLITLLAILIAYSTSMYEANILLQFAELQQAAAISIIAILLAILGSIFIWNENNALPLLITHTTLLLAILYPETTIIAATICAVLGGYALKTLRSRKWDLPTVKTATNYFILLTLLFAATAATSQAIIQEPTNELQETIQLLRELEIQEISTLSTQEEALRWNNIQVREAHNLTQVHSSQQLGEQATTYILIEQDYRAVRLRTILENSRNYVLVRDAEHQLWMRT